MTKGELLQCLSSVDDDVEIMLYDYSAPKPIQKVTLEFTKGNGVSVVLDD